MKIKQVNLPRKLTHGPPPPKLIKEITSAFEKNSNEKLGKSNNRVYWIKLIVILFYVTYKYAHASYLKVLFNNFTYTLNSSFSLTRKNDNI